MVFGHHETKLKEVEKNLKATDYAQAKEIVDKHLQNELKGNTILNNLRGYVNDYEKNLKELQSTLEVLSIEKAQRRAVPNRDILTQECIGNINLAKQNLKSIKDLLDSATQMLEE